MVFLSCALRCAHPSVACNTDRVRSNVVGSAAAPTPDATLGAGGADERNGCDAVAKPCAAVDVDVVLGDSESEPASSPGVNDCPLARCNKVSPDSASTPLDEADAMPAARGGMTGACSRASGGATTLEFWEENGNGCEFAL